VGEQFVSMDFCWIGRLCEPVCVNGCILYVCVVYMCVGECV